jgi:hypothetical protein
MSNNQRTKSTLRLGLPFFILALIVASPVVGLAYFEYTFTNSVEVEDNLTIGVYSDAICQTPLTHYDWGKVQVNSNTTMTAYIKNLSNNTVVTLALFDDGLPIDWRLTWNYDLLALAPQESIPVVFTLGAPSVVVPIFFTVHVQSWKL